MAKVKVTQIRSCCSASKRQIATLKALGIRHLNHCVEIEMNSVSNGMIQKVAHLVKVEEIG